MKRGRIAGGDLVSTMIQLLNLMNAVVNHSLGHNVCMRALLTLVVCWYVTVSTIMATHTIAATRTSISSAASHLNPYSRRPQSE